MGFYLMTHRVRLQGRSSGGVPFSYTVAVYGCSVYLWCTLFTVIITNLFSLRLKVNIRSLLLSLYYGLFVSANSDLFLFYIFLSHVAKSIVFY